MRNASAPLVQVIVILARVRHHSAERARDDAPKPLAMPYQDILIGDLLGAIDKHEMELLMHYPAG